MPLNRGLGSSLHHRCPRRMLWPPPGPPQRTILQNSYVALQCAHSPFQAYALGESPGAQVKPKLSSDGWCGGLLGRCT